MHKEWNPVGGEEGGVSVEPRKRKAMDVLEQDARCKTPAKSRRIDDEMTVWNESRTKSILYLGAKSVSGKETAVGQMREDTNWINWVDLEKEESVQLPGDSDSKTKNI